MNGSYDTNVRSGRRVAVFATIKISNGESEEDGVGAASPSLARRAPHTVQRIGREARTEDRERHEAQAASAAAN